MAQVLCLIGDDWDIPEAWDKGVCPTASDTAILDVETPMQVYVSENSVCGALNMTSFRGDIIYCLKIGDHHKVGILENKDRYDIFINRPEIKRID